MKTETTVPVFANRAPWNELLIMGKRKIKTLSFNWKYRGPILLYTSKERVDHEGWIDYRLRKKLEDIPQGAIVGTAEVLDVMPTECLPQSYFDKDPALFDTTGQAYVVIVGKVKRFKKPVPFKPKQGAIRVFRGPANLLNRATV